MGTPINLASEMKRQVRGTQQPEHIGKIDEGMNAAQQSDSFVQSISVP